MDKVTVEGIKLYAYHGCLDEEAKIGTDYRVDVTVWGDLVPASISDNLDDTLDYVEINQVVKEEMLIRSKLIEHVAQRILNRIIQTMPNVMKAKVKLSKLSPPINGNVDSVSTIMTVKR